MEIIINGRMGGTENIDQIFHPLIIEFRKKIKNELKQLSYNNEFILKYFFLVNGEIAHYYDSSGIYSSSLNKKKNEASMELCLANLSVYINYNEALEQTKNIFISSISKLKDLAHTGKVEIPILEIELAFNKVFKDMS